MANNTPFILGLISGIIWLLISTALFAFGPLTERKRGKLPFKADPG